MRILLAAKHAPEGRRPIGGVQTWCRTVKDELERRGIEAVTWGPEQAIPLGGFDFGIIANAKYTRRAFDLCRRTVTVSHGIIPAEQPILGENFVFTSEEIRSHWNVEGEIVRQPIDLEYWSPVVLPDLYLTRFSYRRGLNFVPTIANRLGVRYFHLRNSPPDQVRDVVQKSLAVLATGRAALEAMACDIPVVLCDDRSAYQGPLLDLDIEGAMARNYSGRGGIVPTMENVTEAVNASIERGGLRAHVKAFHDVRQIVDQLLEYA